MIFTVVRTATVLSLLLLQLGCQVLPKPVPPPRDISTAQYEKKNPDCQLKPLFQQTPRYPQDAYRNGTEGWVVVKFNVLSSGKPIDMTVVDASPTAVFDTTALATAANLIYPKVIEEKSLFLTGCHLVLQFLMN